MCLLYSFWLRSYNTLNYGQYKKYLINPAIAGSTTYSPARREHMQAQLGSAQVPDTAAFVLCSGPRFNNAVINNLIFHLKLNLQHSLDVLAYPFD